MAPRKYRHRSIARRQTNFDILNLLGVSRLSRQCHGHSQSSRQTDTMVENSPLLYGAGAL